jgi:hypothetical protein
MPTRILRAELLDSEAWLSLKDNADRAAWISCFLSVDTLGNMPAGTYRLIKLWRCYGIETPEKIAKVLAELADVDLVRLYEIDGKPFLHIPRFGQSRRYLGHVWPLSPWNTEEEKQMVARKAPVNRRCARATHGEPPLGVGVGVGVEVTTTSLTLTSKAGRQNSRSDPPPPVDQVPYAKIVDLYHRMLPELPRVVRLSEARKGQIRARWKGKDAEDLSDWEAFFGFVRKSKFLMGAGTPRDGRKPFRADLPWLIREENFLKVLEGRYE